jgi:hypothetical protein
VQRGLSGGPGHVPLRLRVEVVLCDPTEELLDECWTCRVGAMCQVVQQLGREHQASGVERYQLPPQPFVRERELNRLVDAAPGDSRELAPTCRDGSL